MGKSLKLPGGVDEAHRINHSALYRRINKPTTIRKEARFKQSKPFTVQEQGLVKWIINLSGYRRSVMFNQLSDVVRFIFIRNSVEDVCGKSWIS